MVKCIFTTKATTQQYNRIERQRFQFTCARERICAEKLRRTFFRSEASPRLSGFRPISPASEPLVSFSPQPHHSFRPNFPAHLQKPPATQANPCLPPSLIWIPIPIPSLCPLPSQVPEVVNSGCIKSRKDRTTTSRINRSITVKLEVATKHSETRVFSQQGKRAMHTRVNQDRSAPKSDDIMQLPVKCLDPCLPPFTFAFQRLSGSLLYPVFCFLVSFESELFSKW